MDELNEEPISGPVIDEEPISGFDIESELEPGNFDLDSWISGLATFRRAVTIHGRPDVLAEIDVIDDRLKRAQGSRRAALLKERVRLEKIYHASALDIIMQPVTREYTVEMMGRIEELKKAEPDDMGKQVEEVELKWLAAHIVQPEGFDLERLRTINEKAPSIINALSNKATDVDLESAGKINPQFRK